MNSVAIVADSTCDLSPELVKKFDIEIVPANILFDGEVISQDNITNEEFFSRLKAGAIPTTGVPAPKKFKTAYDAALTKADKVLALTVIGDLSSMFSTATVVANQFYDNNEVVVLDSKAVTLQFGLIVYEAAKLAAANHSLEEIVPHIQSAIVPNSHLLGAVDTLKYLRNGGRISRISWLLGSLLSVKPIIHVEDGKLVSPKKIRGQDHAMRALKKAAKKVLKNLHTDTFYCGYSVNKERGQELFDFISDLPNAPAELLLGEIGPTMGAHIGPGAMGYAWIGDFKKKWL